MNEGRRAPAINEATHDAWVIRTRSGLRRRIGGVSSEDEAIAKFAAHTSYKTLEKARAGGVTAEKIPALTQDQQGQKNAEKHSRWFNSPRGGSSVFRRLQKAKKTEEAADRLVSDLLAD